ncbi:fasciclin domain-containing protein [Sphingomonas gilva]|uniref:Fasciclin domain-containing protein n=1 Tax=Sphingomonas gilva TaxID=2305907 RepID=A0A396RM51_9SPHN|nr:fasciclin domain-containing protein [Sphingomonas gilva]
MIRNLGHAALAAIGALALGACSTTMADEGATAAAASANPMVGGAEMLPTRTIVENASASADHTTLVAAVKAAGLVETLSGPGPFTVFAPTNAAFGRLAPGTVDTLLKPENKATLVKVLTYHVVPGNISAAQLQQQITAGGGTATLTTVQGEPLTARMETGAVMLTDVNGNKSYVTQADVRQSNGVVHVVNGVLLPKMG